MCKFRQLIQLLVIASVIAITGANVTHAASVHQAAGECGEYKYWHHGKCVDAREKPGKSWMQSVF